ncbi:MAG: helix-turn-helix transcriptional regulator [Planctomycetota bacterium]
MPLPSEQIKQDKRESINSDLSINQQPGYALLDEKQWFSFQRRYRISPRELEVIKLVCQGLTNGDIALKLNVKPATVQTHLKSIFSKTRVKTKMTMLLRCMENIADLPAN